MPNKPRIYWDSCVYISCIQRTASRIAAIDLVFDEVENGSVELIASALVLAEVAKLDSAGVTSKADAQKIRAFFENDYIKIRPLDRHIGERAAEIAQSHKIKGADAAHLATAIDAKCVSFQTYDGEDGKSNKLLAFNGLIHGLKIELPTATQTVSQKKFL